MEERMERMERHHLETTLSEIRNMKRQLLNLLTLVDDIRTIKDELAELKITCEGTWGT